MEGCRLMDNGKGVGLFPGVETGEGVEEGHYGVFAIFSQ
jgi:hypothetical protein